MDCEICFRDYQSKAIVPRVIECGHTFCTNCITQLFNTSPNCPKCREPFTKETSEAYPINYALLRGIDDHNAFTTTEEGLLKQLKNKKRKLSTMETEWKDTKTEADSNLSKISIVEKSIVDLLNQECLDVELTNETLLEINKIMKEVSSSKIVDDRMLKESVTLSRDNYCTNTAFLKDIYNRLVQHEELYAVTLIANKVNYARLTRFSNRIYLHAFDPSVSTKPNKTIWFSDFKRCFNKRVNAFMELSSDAIETQHTIIILTLSNSNLVSLFLKYCTGETGPVYKGTHFIKDRVCKYTIKTKPIAQSECGQEYVFTSDFKQLVPPDYMKNYSEHVELCRLYQDGSLEIGPIRRNGDFGMVAMLKEPKYFAQTKKYQGMKIRDSGIFIEI